MKSNDLRIGNATMQGVVKSFYENGIHVGFGKCYPFSEVEPVPLTPEILEKVGCSKSISTPNVYLLKMMDTNLIIEYGKGRFYFSVSMCGCKYLHQLQNILHAFTGEELDLKQLNTPHTGQSNAV